MQNIFYYLLFFYLFFNPYGILCFFKKFNDYSSCQKELDKVEYVYEKMNFIMNELEKEETDLEILDLELKNQSIYELDEIVLNIDEKI